MNLTIVTFLWKGWRPVYNAEHVNAWAKMLRANCRGDFRIVCITDMPAGIKECETLPLWDAPQVKNNRRQNCFTRMKLFDPATAALLGNKILHLDLDCVILGDLVGLVGDDPLKALAGRSALINGSMWALTAGAHPELWNDLILEENAFIKLLKGKKVFMIGSDQVWISLKTPNIPTWGKDDGIYQFSHAPIARKRPDAKAVFFAGDFKPWSSVLKMKDPDLFDYYMSFYNGETVR